MSKKGQELVEFSHLLNKTFKNNTKIQTHWVTVTSVDWDNKTMVAKGLTDGLEFYDVLLGVGSYFRKPKVGSKCLIGLILNQDANTFLIECEEFEETVWITQQASLTIKENGFIVKKGNESLREVLNDMIDEINKIIVINGTSISVPAMTAIKQRLNTILIE